MNNGMRIAMNMLLERKFLACAIFILLAPLAFFVASGKKKKIDVERHQERNALFKYNMY